MSGDLPVRYSDKTRDMVITGVGFVEYVPAQLNRVRP